jgi:hypothetical protein
VVNVPVPVPFRDFDPETTGFSPDPQHTPREETVAPPSDITIPPVVADVADISLNGVVVTIGSTGFSSFLHEENKKINSVPNK